MRKTTCLALAVSLVATALATAAPASAALSKNGVFYLDELEFYIKKDKLDAEPCKGENDARDCLTLVELQSDYELAKGKLDRVPAEDRTDPRYVRGARWHASFKAKLDTWRAADAARGVKAAASGAAVQAHRKAAYESRYALALVAEYRAGSKSPSGGRVIDASTLLEHWKAASSLTAFAELCKGWGVMTGPDEQEKNAHCKDANEWRTVLTPVFEEQARAGIAADADATKKLIETIRDGGDASPSEHAQAKKSAAAVASAKAKYAPVYAALGKAIPADAFAPLTSATAGYDAALKSSVAKVRYKSAGGADGAVGQAVAKEITQAKLKIVKQSQSPGWEIAKNELDIPTHREKTAAVLAKAPGEGYCRLYEVSVHQDYTGGGKYQSALNARFDATDKFAVASCK